jgi:transcriptional regulator with GAF, ATPase, and Fis domain
VIGESRQFRRAREQAEVVAPADTSVLLLGETGTGKELVARAIHDQSRRAARPFVPINCAALPESLVESELFGYEKGAFTGALGRKAGKFELAHLGTIFLDEIGDLPVPAQAKLLRVLQEREVQRIGGVTPVPVDVRLIAATNQDLELSMSAGRFRADLFYRLSVFPIRLPPLRDRRDDIAQLVSLFVARFADQQHKPAPKVTPAAMERLLAYDWPGNVRELQNVIERAVILTRGVSIEPSAITLSTPPTATGHATVETRISATQDSPCPNVIRFSDAERRAIVRALERAGWRVSGTGGAAEVLGLKPTTLHAKMKKLGIRRPSVFEHSAASASS